MKPKQKPKTTKQLARGYLKYWQKQLRLMDWNFELEVIDDPIEGFGKTSQMPNNQTARITILDPKDIPEDWNGLRDLEVTVVHEILHTRLLYAIGKKHDYHAEMAIETLSACLVSLRRGIKIEELE